MIVTVIDALQQAGIPKESIHTEYFTPAAEKKDAEPVPEGTFLLTAKLRGKHIEIPIREQTILHTLEDAGYDPPYSCTSGTCSTCMAKLISGKVHMDHAFALSDQDIADGFVLTCQAHPVDGNVEVDYDY
jgi:ring-1,2-phenylacetyl-CoA epoxidase subunit PaaE